MSFIADHKKKSFIISNNNQMAIDEKLIVKKIYFLTLYKIGIKQCNKIRKNLQRNHKSPYEQFFK